MKNELDFLSTSANDLDLTDSDDRAVFRARVAERLNATTVAAMCEWVSCVERDRHTVSRAVADAYISRQASK